jgi:hypothetical protein
MERLPIWTVTGPASGRFFSAFVGVRDECGPALLQAEALHDVLRQDQRHCPCVDDGIDGRTADVGLLPVPPLDNRAVPGILQLDGNDDFTHFSSPVAHPRVLP